MNDEERMQRGQRIDEAENALRKFGHTREELLLLTVTGLGELVNECGVFLEEPDIECRLLRARIEKWPRKRVMRPR